MTQLMQRAEARFLPAPSACGNEFENVEWSGTVAVHLRDDLHLGLRFNDAALQQHVVGALGDRVRDHRSPVPYYSVRLGTPGRRKAAPMHHLYLGNRPVVGTRDIGRLLGGIAQHLSPHLADPPDGYVVEAIPVQTPTGLLLVPQEILAMTGTVDRLLTPAGFRFADVPRATLDPSAGTVGVPAPVVDIPVTPEQAAALGPSVPEERLEPGDHRLAGWLLGVTAAEAGPLRPAAAVAYAARQLGTPFPHGAQAALDAIADLVGRVRMLGVTWATHDELVGQVRAAGLGEA